jgi:tRNA nucleotidyltransferase/poly(A) polymerase
MDLTCRDAEGFANRLAAARNAVVVAFEKKPDEPCYRVVDREDQDNHLDLAPMKGGSPGSDLACRDFTLNAMAQRIVAGEVSDELLNPFHGAEDIERRLIRMTGPKAFATDPLRILRAFRFAAELGFEIEAGTLAAMKQWVSRLKEVATERVLSELLKIYESAQSAAFTRLMDETGVLEIIFPEILAMRGCTQNSFHHKDV